MITATSQGNPGDQLSPNIDCRTLTARQVAALLGVSVHNVYAAARSGQLVALKLGRRVEVCYKRFEGYSPQEQAPGPHVRKGTPGA